MGRSRGKRLGGASLLHGLCIHHLYGRGRSATMFGCLRVCLRMFACVTECFCVRVYISMCGNLIISIYR